MKFLIRGRTNVVKNHLEDDEEDVSDPKVLRDIASKNKILAGLVEPEMLFGEYVDDGSEMGKSVSDAITGGGWVSLSFDEPSGHLLVSTEYELGRKLNATELQFLTKETLGQWSDGGGGGAMDEFSEHIEPYYVDVYPYLDDYDVSKPHVELIDE